MSYDSKIDTIITIDGTILKIKMPSVILKYLNIHLLCLEYQIHLYIILSKKRDWLFSWQVRLWTRLKCLNLDRFTQYASWFFSLIFLTNFKLKIIWTTWITKKVTKVPAIAAVQGSMYQANDCWHPYAYSEPVVRSRHSQGTGFRALI